MLFNSREVCNAENTIFLPLTVRGAYYISNHKEQGGGDFQIVWSLGSMCVWNVYVDGYLSGNN